MYCFEEVKKKYEDAILNLKRQLSELNEKLQTNYAECKVLSEINASYCVNELKKLRERQNEIENEINKLKELISDYQRIVEVAKIKAEEQEKAEN